MTIISNNKYGLKGSQVIDLADRVKEAQSTAGAAATLVATKQDALTATQLNAVNSGIDSTKVGQIATNTTNIDGIEAKIPAQATSSNQLADKNFVNSSVATNTANYISDNGQPFTSLADLEAYSGTLTNNDYAFVVGTDAAGNTTYTRYKYNADTDAWAEEYVLNNSSFTADQWAAIQSGITSGLVTKLNGIEVGAEVNTIDSISVNGTAVTPDANKNVDLMIDGGIKTLTTADYNYPTSAPSGISIYRLDDGYYIVGESVNIYTHASAYISETFAQGSVLIKVGSHAIWKNASSYQKQFTITNDTSNVTSNVEFGNIVDALNSSSSVRPLSANQGRVLNNNIGDLTTLTTTAKTSAVAAINELDSDKPEITMSSTDPGEGATLAANNFIAYYE